MCRSIEEIPRISSLIRDPRTVLLLVALFGGAVGVDTVAASLVSSVAEASP